MLKVKSHAPPAAADNPGWPPPLRLLANGAAGEAAEVASPACQLPVSVVYEAVNVDGLCWKVQQRLLAVAHHVPSLSLFFSPPSLSLSLTLVPSMAPPPARR
eukprot:2843759-Pyramimonas_sp.AAC.1